MSLSVARRTTWDSLGFALLWRSWRSYARHSINDADSVQQVSGNASEGLFFFRKEEVLFLFQPTHFSPWLKCDSFGCFFCQRGRKCVFPSSLCFRSSENVDGQSSEIPMRTSQKSRKCCHPPTKAHRMRFRIELSGATSQAGWSSFTHQTHVICASATLFSRTLSISSEGYSLAEEAVPNICAPTAPFASRPQGGFQRNPW